MWKTMMLIPEGEKYRKNVADASDEELQLLLETLEGLDEQSEKEYFAAHRKRMNETFWEKIDIVKDEIKSRRQKQGEEILEGVDGTFRIAILFNRGSKIPDERGIREMIEKLPGVKCVEVDGDYGEVCESELGNVFYRYYGDDE